MASPRRLAFDSAALRARAGRLAERAEALPKWPFAVAVVVSIAMLAAVLVGASDPGQRVAQVGMFEAQGYDVNDGIEADARVEPVEIEIVEYGFGDIEMYGQRRLTVGAVVRNPHPTAVAHLVFTASGAGGQRVLDTFRINYVPPGSEVLIGHILDEQAEITADERLELAVETASFDPPFESPPPDYLPGRFAVLGVEPLLSPEGQRIAYRIDSELGYTELARVDVVFRGADGTIVGGVGGDERVIDGADSTGLISVPPGTSVHHFNLRSEEIPEGADLLQTEIGPGGVIPGG
ncbi:hypothetical protein [Glycomyces tenuis]|uniref:hypothetical protein n=1 Tax=Glycomyces tenuis TaxID=58116 RepID=UPI00041FA9BA|nr:hypothetical protein [Glycomyces tenuis]